MKKTFAKIISAVAAFACALPLAACGENSSTEAHVYMPDGAPAIALSCFMSEGYAGADFTVVAASVIKEQVTTGKADMAIIPVNAAAAIYNQGVDIVMLSVNTHGNLFIVGDGSSATLNDLVGKKLGVIGRGDVPDQVLRLLLDRANIEYEESENAVENKVALTYAADGGVLLPLLKQGVVDYALLPEPAATTAVGNLGKSIVLDIQSAWKSNFSYEYPQACLVAQGKFVDDNKAFVDKFLEDLKASDMWAMNNPDKAVEAVKSHMAPDTVSSFTTLTAAQIERCNIRTEYADDMKVICNQYFDLLTKFPTGTGTMALAKVPDDGFYYGK